MEILIASELPDYKLNVEYGEDYCGKYTSYVLYRKEITHFICKYEDDDWFLITYREGKRELCTIEEFRNKEDLITYIRDQYA